MRSKRLRTSFLALFLATLAMQGAKAQPSGLIFTDVGDATAGGFASIKLTRSGTVFIGSASMDGGVTWSDNPAVDTASWGSSLPDSLAVGLAITAHHNSYISWANAEHLNGWVFTPPPVIKDLTLGGEANNNLWTFRAANSEASFHVTTTVGVNTATGLVFKVNGVVKTPTITGGGASTMDFTVRYSDFPVNTLLNLSLVAYDTQGRFSSTATMAFDTMTESLYMIEAEDFNFEGGKFFEGNGVGQFLDKTGVQGVDRYVATPNDQSLTNTFTGEVTTNHRYRYLDTNDLAHTEWVATGGPTPNEASTGILSYDPYIRQKYIDTYSYDTMAGVDYYVGWSQRGEWWNYTRTFDFDRNYKVYARLSTGNSAGFVLNAFKVTGDTTQSNTQVTSLLGTFSTPTSPGGDNNFKFYPLLDAMGNEVVNLKGQTTLRMEVFSGSLNANYYVFVPVAVSGATPPVIARATPAKDAVSVPLDGVIKIVLANGSNPIPADSVKLFFNGTDVTAASTIATVTGGVTVKYTSPTFLEKNTNYTITLVMGDGAATQRLYTNTWQYTTMQDVALLTAAMAKPLASVWAAFSGFSVRLLQTTGSGIWAQTVIRTEQQLAGTFVDPATGLVAVPDVMAYATPSVINYNETTATQAGNFGNDSLFPGFASGEPQNVVMEMVAYLKLNRGAYRFGVNSEDGFRLTAGPNPQDTTIVVGESSGGPGATDAMMNLLVETNGIYPIRLIYVHGYGDWHCEFFCEDGDGNRTLINGTNAAGQIPVPAYRYISCPCQPVTFASPLKSIAVREVMNAVFSANSLYATSTNSLVLVYQWYEKVAGASTFTAIDPAVNSTAQRPILVLKTRLPSNSGDSYYCSVGLLGYPLINSTTATLSVVCGCDGPYVVDVRYVDSTHFRVAFSEPVMAGTGMIETSPALVVHGTELMNLTNLVVNVEAMDYDKTFTIRISGVQDLSGNLMQFPTTNTLKTPVYAPGYALDNYYLNIGNGVEVSDLTNNAKYPNSPDEAWTVSTTDSHYVDARDNYGQKMYGFIIPSEDGDYRFAISGDDNCALFLATDADPATPGSTAIATVSGWTGHLDWYNASGAGGANQISAPQHLTAGTKYAFYALEKEGGGGDSLAIGWITPSQITTNVVLIPSANLGAYLDPYGAQITVSNAPANVAVLEYHTATFTVVASGSWAYGNGGFTYQWLLNGTPIPGATSNSYTTGEVLLDNTGDQYSVRLVYPSILTNTTAAATLTVLPDTNAPKGLSAGSFAQTVGVRFDKNINTNAGQATFTVTGGALVTNVLWINRSSAVLLLDKAITGAQTVSLAAKDLPGNTVTTNLNVGLLPSFASTDIGTNDLSQPGVIDLPAFTDPIVPGATYAFSETDFDVKAGGSDIGNNGDNCHFDYKEITGDFDVMVRVKTLFPTSRWAKAGLMARETLEGQSKNMNVVVDPANGPTPEGGNGRDAVEANCRLATAGSSGGWPGGSKNYGQSTFPNAWVRLQRVGQTFTAYRGWDGQTWMQVAQSTITNERFADQLFVGVCTTSHRNTTNEYTWAQYSDFGDITNPKTWLNLAVNTDNLVAARGEYPPNELAKNAIDDNSGTKWLDFSATSWIVVSLNYPATITKYSITSANDAAERDPAAWTLRGSTDSYIWVVLDQKANVVSWHDRLDSAYFDIASPAAYQYYKLEVTNHSGSIFQMAELGLWQVPPESHPDRPGLGIANVIGQVTISWPDSAGFQLYTTPVLGSGASWTVVPGDVLNGSVRSVTLPSTNPKAFYQLKK